MISMMDAVDNFLDFYRNNRNRSPRTDQIYRLALGRLNDFFGEIGKDWRNELGKLLMRQRQALMA